jgi:hypothetical protein
LPEGGGERRWHPDGRGTWSKLSIGDPNLATNAHPSRLMARSSPTRRTAAHRGCGPHRPRCGRSHRSRGRRHERAFMCMARGAPAFRCRWPASFLPDSKPIWLEASYRPAPSWGFIGKHDLDLGVAVEQDLTASAAGGASAWPGPNTGSAAKSSARCAETLPEHPTPAVHRAGRSGRRSLPQTTQQVRNRPPPEPLTAPGQGSKRATSLSTWFSVVATSRPRRDGGAGSGAGALPDAGS